MKHVDVKQSIAGVGPLILYELNEVPWRVWDWYVARRPDGAIARLLRESATFTTVTRDEGELHPWSTWPTLHRGVDNRQHHILFLNQDKSCADAFPTVWETAAQAGVRVGVFGSLQSYPVPESGNYAFYVPDTFAPGPELPRDRSSSEHGDGGRSYPGAARRARGRARKTRGAFEQE